MGVNKCELCSCPARIHCESDQASLCWECDAKVHGANFLVARHSRCLLCRRCQSPTPWRAEGSRLGATISVCQLCAAASSGSIEGSGEGGCSARCVEEAKEEEEGESENSDEEEEEEEMEEESESGKEEDDIDEGDNQVVPWSPTPPPVASSSSSGYEEEESDRTTCNTGGFLKRMRENADLVVSQVNLILCSRFLHIYILKYFFIKQTFGFQKLISICRRSTLKLFSNFSLKNYLKLSLSQFLIHENVHDSVTG